LGTDLKKLKCRIPNPPPKFSFGFQDESFLRVRLAQQSFPFCSILLAPQSLSFYCARHAYFPLFPPSFPSRPRPRLPLQARQAELEAWMASLAKKPPPGAPHPMRSESMFHFLTASANKPPAIAGKNPVDGKKKATLPAPYALPQTRAALTMWGLRP
jgi:hypothetical protein